LVRQVLVAVVVAARRLAAGLPQAEAGVVNSYGIKGVFSRLVHGTQPVVDGKPVEFDVWLSPTMCRWDYTPTDRDGPYRMVRADAVGGEGGAIYAYLESPTFMGLVTEFATEHMPRRGEVCAILDRHCTIVVGWITHDGKLEWQGCEYAFSQLAHHHPISAVLWERQAKARADEELINLGEWYDPAVD
jgi:hypothetical protein